MFIDRLIKSTGATVYVPIYPLVKKGTSAYKQNISLLVKTYKEVTKSFKKNITIMGDSAGGNLAYVLAQHIKQEGLITPKNIIGISPAINLSDIGDKDEVVSKALIDIVGG
jgi:acetyl esterase/lipase